MTAIEKFKSENSGMPNPLEAGYCPDGCGYLAEPSNCQARMGIFGNSVPTHAMSCKECWDREIPSTEDPVRLSLDEVIEKTCTLNPEIGKLEMEESVKSLAAQFGNACPRILDSGNRRQFESGAVRDIQEGKGRCDLLPLDVVARFYRRQYPQDGDNRTWIFHYIGEFLQTGSLSNLYEVLNIFSAHFGNYETMYLEVAKHFEEGCKKYGENNWRKGIPVHCYIDSGVRHYLKFLRGDKDEPHDRAFCWNIMCAIWTCKHKPELNEYSQLEEPV